MLLLLLVLVLVLVLVMPCWLYDGVAVVEDDGLVALPLLLAECHRALVTGWGVECCELFVGIVRKGRSAGPCGWCHLTLERESRAISSKINDGLNADPPPTHPQVKVYVLNRRHGPFRDAFESNPKTSPHTLCSANWLFVHSGFGVDGHRWGTPFQRRREGGVAIITDSPHFPFSLVLERKNQQIKRRTPHSSRDGAPWVQSGIPYSSGVARVFSLDFVSTIVAWQGTPFEGGTFVINIDIPTGYPFEPPKMKFITKIWHPNISSQTGAICLVSFFFFFL